jgi:hypothetical protein
LLVRSEPEGRAWENGTLRLSVTRFQNAQRVDLPMVDWGRTCDEKDDLKNESVVENGVVEHGLAVVGVL